MAERFIDRVHRIAYEQNITTGEAIRVARISERMDKAKADRMARTNQGETND